MRSTRSRINVTVILLVILVLGAIGGAGYMYMQNKKLKKDVQTAKDQKDGKISNEELLRKIGEHIVLPSNETPAILTVDDKDKLKDPNVKLSKKLAWLLRHNAEKEGLNISKYGYVLLDDVMNYLLAYGWKTISFETIKQIVDTNDKKRY